ncbi:MAG: hypothetical protein AAF517_15705 [Planctomycetota bacterium]
MKATRRRVVFLAGSVGAVLCGILLAMRWESVVDWYHLREVTGEWHLRYAKYRTSYPLRTGELKFEHYAFGRSIRIFSSGILENEERRSEIRVRDDQLELSRQLESGKTHTDSFAMAFTQSGELVLTREGVEVLYARGPSDGTEPKIEIDMTGITTL